MNAWIEWNDGPCPVHPKAMVEVQYEDGETEVAVAGKLVWGYVKDDHMLRIARYRVVSEAKDCDGAQHAKVVSDGSTARALDTQEGGSHYKSMAIQPVEYIYKNGIGYFEGCVIKYVSRWKNKNGVEDLKKARHFLDLLIEFEEGVASAERSR